MNICKICLKISDEKKRSSIKERIKENYIGNLENCNNEQYEKVKSDLYKELRKNSKLLFNLKSILAVRDLGDVKYYILEKSDIASRDQVTFDVIVVMKDSQLTNAVYTVFNDIQNNLESENLKIEYNPEIVFIYLTKNEDLLDNYIHIKANFDGNDEPLTKNKKIITQFIINCVLWLLTIGFYKYTNIFGALLGASISFTAALIMDCFYSWWIHKHNRIIVKDFQSKWFDEDKKVQETQENFNPRDTGLVSAATKIKEGQ